MAGPLPEAGIQDSGKELGRIQMSTGLQATAQDLDWSPDFEIPIRDEANTEVAGRIYLY